MPTHSTMTVREHGSSLDGGSREKDFTHNNTVKVVTVNLLSMDEVCVCARACVRAYVRACVCVWPTFCLLIMYIYALITHFWNVPFDPLDC